MISDLIIHVSDDSFKITFVYLRVTDKNYGFKRAHFQKITQQNNRKENSSRFIDKI